MAAVLVHIDLDGGRPDPSSLLALAAGRHVASSWGATLYAAVIVYDTSEHTPASSARVVAGKTVPGLDETEATLGRIGADKIIVALSDVEVVPLWGVIGNAWQTVLDHLRPRLVLFGADSPSAAELAPRTGARIGARLLRRARAIGIDDVELRDRDGGYARVSDGGAAVAMIGRADPTPAADEDVDLVVLAAPGGADPRVEVVDVTTAEVARARIVVIVLGDEVATDPKLVAKARARGAARRTAGRRRRRRARRCDRDRRRRRSDDRARARAVRDDRRRAGRPRGRDQRRRDRRTKGAARGRRCRPARGKRSARSSISWSACEGRGLAR